MIDKEDGDDIVDIDAAARFRQILQQKAQNTLDPLHQSLMDLMNTGQDMGVNIDNLMDFDPDTSDIDESW